MYSVWSRAVEIIVHLFKGCFELIDLWCRIAIWWSGYLSHQIYVQSLLSWSDSVSLRGGQ